jgi:acyl transferase domain-containing protein
VFSIPPREALAMDPQHRLLLERAWEASSTPGIDRRALRAADAASSPGSCPRTTARGGEARRVEGLFGTGGSLLSGRLSYAFGLEGPAVSVDTACSSSLVAIHLACQALRRASARLALAGGVTVMATPALFVEFARQRGLRRTGAASRSARRRRRRLGGGRGLLVLERLSTRARTATRCWPWCAAARSTRTARRTASPRRTARRRSG